MKSQELRVFKDLGFTVIVKANEYHVDYEIYEIHGYVQDEKGEFFIPCYGGRGESTEIDEIDKFISGFVKWDGCSNWSFLCEDGMMMHACDREHLVNIGQIMGKCFDMTAEYCENWMY